MVVFVLTTAGTDVATEAVDDPSANPSNPSPSNAAPGDATSDGDARARGPVCGDEPTLLPADVVCRPITDAAPPDRVEPEPEEPAAAKPAANPALVAEPTAEPERRALKLIGANCGE